MRNVVPLVVSIAVSATVGHAQEPAPLVPAGGMSAGCPSAWAHRDGGEASFGCRDVVSGAFCNGAYRATAGATQSEEVDHVRADIVAMGFVILREADHDGMHALVYDDAAGHRMMELVRRLPGRVVDVRCGAPVPRFDALTSTFVEVASSAH